MYDTPPGYRLINDTAFPRCTNRLDYRILAPMKRGDCVPDSPWTFARQKILNEQLVSARQAAEWGMRALQGSFARLKLPLPATEHQFQAEVIELAVRVHQLRCQAVGINQTRLVYQQVKEENGLLSQDFRMMLFGDITRHCWISCYYNGWM